MGFNVGMSDTHVLPCCEYDYAGLAFEPLGPVLGAEVRGVDLASALSGETVAALHAGLLQHKVLVFRDQDISHEAHIAFGRLFGELHIHPNTPGPEGHPEILPNHADANSKRINGERWHSDVSCDPEPPMGSILNLKVVPPVGGDTIFASMYAAYDALSEPMKKYLAALTAIHDGSMNYTRTNRLIGAEGPTTLPRAEHPVIRTHPVTGKQALYVNRGFTKRIVGLPRDESSAILHYLWDHAENELFQCRFRWQEDSIAFWDNRCVQHRAMWDYWPHTRSGHRVTVAGDRPV